mgnify:CR=1 FL=1
MFSIDQIISFWNDFFFTPESPFNIALLRILWGILLLASGFLYYHERHFQYGPNGILHLDFYKKAYSGTRRTLLTVLPQKESSVDKIYFIYFIFSLFVLVGFLTNISAFVVFICLTSLHNRNPLSIYSGDDILRIVCFFIAFSGGGLMMSVDAIIFDYPENIMASPWGTRLLQIFVSFIYIKCVLWKLKGPLWRNGTAVHYPLYVEIYKRWSLPKWLRSKNEIKFLTYSTLVVELSLGTLIWVEEFRLPVLAAGILLHLGMEYAMNLQLFEWKMICLLMIFLPII